MQHDLQHRDQNLQHSLNSVLSNSRLHRQLFHRHWCKACSNGKDEILRGGVQKLRVLALLHSMRLRVRLHDYLGTEEIRQNDTPLWTMTIQPHRQAGRK